MLEEEITVLKDETIREMFDDDAINGKPVYTLAECLTLTTYEEGPADTGYEGPGIAEGIKEGFRKAVYLCDEQKIAFLHLVAGLSEKKAAWEDITGYYPFNVFYFRSFVYLFKDDGAYYLVLPAELAEIFREVMEDQDFTAINAKNLELTSYATALLELYGAYEIEYFAEVWNHHHKEKLADEEANVFLQNLMLWESDYYLDENFVVHDCLDEVEFEELLDQTFEVEYYMPTKNVIEECVNMRRDYSYKIPGEKEMDSFLAGYINDEWELDDLQIYITESCKRLKDPMEIRDILEEAEAPLDNEAFVEKFESLYNNLRGNCHIWELCGFTPDQYQNQNEMVVPYFRLPKD